MSKQKTYVAMVLDRSGSMYGVTEETVAAFNRQVETIREEAKDHDTTVTFVTFSNNARLEYFNAAAATLKPLSPGEYRPDGQTALFDAVGLAVEHLQAVKDANDEDTSFLVIVVTDGIENNSRRHSASSIARILKEKQQTDRWSFVFQMPPGTGKEFSRTFGVPDDNIREWKNTREGTVEAGNATQAGLKNYFGARKRGVRAVAAFYVNTDLSDVSVEEVKAKLVDQSDRFKQYDVPKEESVKEFVEAKTKKPYVIGSAYYLLMKTEKVQPKKGVVIMEKGKKAVWAGPDARKLIGLPDGVDAKVTPGNHANYDIYVQSKSVNRKLPRGTKLLLDTEHKKDAEPTWDHTAVKPKAATTA